MVRAPMSSWWQRIPLKESRAFVIVSAVLLAALLIALAAIPKPVKQERNMAKRQMEGKTITPESYVPIWLYKGLKANIALASLLLLASPWLGRRKNASDRFLELPAKVSRVKNWEWAALVALIGFAAWQNAPRLHLSMWGDEEFNASRFILDKVEHAPDGSLVIEERSWTTTLWNMRKPTNHLGYSFFARLSHDTFFKKGTGPDDPWFSEALLRAPVFIAGLLLIPALFWAMRVWALSPWWAVLLLVLHPWFLRFGVDGRGYGFIMLGAVLQLGILGRALQTNRWGWWAALGFAAFFVLWSNLQGLYVVGAIHLTALVALCSRQLTMRVRLLLASRWIVAGVFTALLVIGYLSPCWPQLQEFMAKREIGGDLDARFWRDGMSAWFAGQPWHYWNQPDNPLQYSLEGFMSAYKPWFIAALALFCTLFIGGVLRLLSSQVHHPLILFTLGAPALLILHMYVSNNRPYDWYFSPFIPGMFIVICAAGEWPWLRNRKLLLASLALIAVGLYAAMTQRPRHLLRNHPLEPCKESVAAYRQITNARNSDIEKEIMSGSIGMYTEGYDPALYRANTVAELKALMAEADRTGRTLYLNMGYFTWLRIMDNTRDMCTVVDDPALFEHVGTFYGLMPYTTRDVFRYKGGAR